MSIQPGTAIAKATFRSYANAFAKAYRANPLLVTVVGLSAASLLLLVTAFQLQAVIPLLSRGTLGALAQAQVDDVSRASLTGLAAVGWGLTLLIETVGFQSSGLLSVAATRGVGPLNRAIGRDAPTLIAAGVTSFALIGPASFAGVYRSLLIHGGLSAQYAAALAAVLLVCVVTASTITALAIPALVGLASRQARDTPAVKAGTAALSGGLLITGAGLVLAGNTAGLYVVAPPLILTAGAPHSLAGAAAVIGASLIWFVLCAGLNCRNSDLTVSNNGMPWQLRLLRLPDAVSTLELRQMVRDTVLTAATAVTFTSSLAVGFLYRSGTLDRLHANLVILAVVGLSSLGSCIVAFRTATISWLYMTRPGAYRRWYYAAVPALLTRTIVVLALSRALTTLPPDLRGDAILLCIAVTGSMIGHASGVLVNRPGITPENKSGLFGGGMLATAVFGILMWPTMKFQLFNSASATIAYLLSTAAIAGLIGSIVVRRRLAEYHNVAS